MVETTEQMLLWRAFSALLQDENISRDKDDWW